MAHRFLPKVEHKVERKAEPVIPVRPSRELSDINVSPIGPRPAARKFDTGSLKRTSTKLSVNTGGQGRPTPTNGVKPTVKK